MRNVNMREEVRIMKNRKPTKTHRAFALIYSPTGVGKTVSSIRTSPRPIRYYEAEPRPVERACEGVCDLTNVDIGHPENFVDLLDDITENYQDIINNYKTVIVDSLTFLMNVTLLGEIERETGEANVFEKSARPLVNMGRTDQTGYGSMASLMKRLCGLLGRIATEGVLVICTALQTDNPKWNRDLAAAPALAGREFPRDMPGYFDIIGRVEMRRGEDGEVLYPPTVWFASDESDSFLAKWSGPPLPRPYTLLNWEKILNFKTQQKEE